MANFAENSEISFKEMMRVQSFCDWMPFRSLTSIKGAVYDVILSSTGLNVYTTAPINP